MIDLIPKKIMGGAPGVAQLMSAVCLVSPSLVPSTTSVSFTATSPWNLQKKINWLGPHLKGGAHVSGQHTKDLHPNSQCWQGQSQVGVHLQVPTHRHKHRLHNCIHPSQAVVLSSKVHGLHLPEGGNPPVSGLRPECWLLSLHSPSSWHPQYCQIKSHPLDQHITPYSSGMSCCWDTCGE